MNWRTAVVALVFFSCSVTSLCLHAAEAAEPLCQDWHGRHPEWIWCDDFEADRLDRYFEHDIRHGRFVREAGAGYGSSFGMRAEFLPGDPHGGFLHVAFGKTPSVYMRPVDDGGSRYCDIYWRFDLRLQAGWLGGGADKLTRAMVLASDRFAQAAIGHVWSGAAPGSDPDRLYLDPASGTDETGILRTTTYNDFPRLRWLGSAGGRTPLFDDQHVGRWWCIEAHMKLNRQGADDGLFEFWVDDELQARRTDLNWVGAYSVYGINAVYLENYWTSVPFSTVQQRYFDNFIVSTSRIGCAR
jgi:hypothetical protein